MKGEVTTAGSQYVAKNSPPARQDAALMGTVRRSDVAIVGKTNLTEFALGTTGANESFGTPINPLDHHRIPGGSSSGSAVAVANDEADVAFGSDTAGSIRVPAACCGILGLKTTFGLISLKGVFPLSPKHLDTIGPMAKDVPNLVKGMELLDPGFSNRYETAKANQPSRSKSRSDDFMFRERIRKSSEAIDDALKAGGFHVVRLDDHFRDQWVQAQLNGSAVAIGDGWLSDRQYSANPVSP